LFSGGTLDNRKHEASWGNFGHKQSDPGLTSLHTYDSIPSSDDSHHDPKAKHKCGSTSIGGVQGCSMYSDKHFSCQWGMHSVSPIGHSMLNLLQTRQSQFHGCEAAMYLLGSEHSKPTTSGFSHSVIWMTFCLEPLNPREDLLPSVLCRRK